MKRNQILVLLTLFLVFCTGPLIAQVCSGTPTPGTISPSTTSSCTPFTSLLALTGASSGTDITYQWEVSTDGIVFSPITGATTTTYSASITDSFWYRNVVTCTTSGLSDTTLVALLYIESYPITGAMTVCAGFTTSLSNSVAGGAWSSSTPAVATIHPATGVVTGVMAGTTTISYSFGSGCLSTAVVTVNPLPPAIGGAAGICAGSTTTLTNSLPGGVWTSANPVIATIGFTSGNVAGLVAGTSTMTYTISTGCFNIRTVTVNPLPAPITGAVTVCAGSTTTFASTTPGGAWSSSDFTVASVGILNGVVTGVAPGTATITYSLPATGCIATRIVIVLPTPGPISGTGNVCVGATTTLTSTLSGGTWSSSNPAVATIGATTGVISGVMLGTTVIAYTLPTGGCQATKIITVQPLPTVYSVTGGGSYCAGGTGVSVGLSGSDIGISYVLHFGASVTGFAVGTGTALDFGLHTAAGTYTAVATNALTGCSRNMADSAVITITPLVTPSVSIITGVGDSVCAGTTVTFTPIPVNGGTAPIYEWSVNSTLVGTGSSYTYIPAHGDTIQVVLTSNATCAAPDTAVGSLVMSVLTPETPLVSFTLFPGDTICQYTPTTFTAVPVFGGSAPSYRWMVNGSVLGTTPTFTYVPANGDVVSVKMFSNYLCRLVDSAVSGTVTMSVAPLTIPHVNIYASPGLLIAPGQVDTLTAIVTSGGPTPTYQWQVNGLDVPGATTATFISTFNHKDSVSCVVTSSGVCHGITVFDWVFITHNNVGVQSVAIGEMDVRLMPNPNKGSFVIKGSLGSSNDEDVNIEITNMLGQVVYSSKVQARAGRIYEQVQTANSMANDMYILNIRSATEQKAFHLVIEQ